MISIVMPAHNESAFLVQSIHDVVGGLRSQRRDFDLHIVENGSTDDTLTIANELAAEMPELSVQSLPAADYGAALRAGLLHATGDLVVIFDVDYYDLDFLNRALAVLESSGPDAPAIVVGSKRAAGSHDTRPRLRRLVTAVFSGILRFGYGLRVSDTHGMKALRRAVVEPVAEQCVLGVDLFDTELILRAERAGIHTSEVPVTVEERRPSRTPILRRVPRTLLGLVRLRWMLWRVRSRRAARRAEPGIPGPSERDHG